MEGSLSIAQTARNRTDEPVITTGPTAQISSPCFGNTHLQVYEPSIQRLALLYKVLLVENLFQCEVIAVQYRLHQPHHRLNSRPWGHAAHGPTIPSTETRELPRGEHGEDVMFAEHSAQTSSSVSRHSKRPRCTMQHSRPAARKPLALSRRTALLTEFLPSRRTFAFLRPFTLFLGRSRRARGHLCVPQWAMAARSLLLSKTLRGRGDSQTQWQLLQVRGENRRVL